MRPAFTLLLLSSFLSLAACDLADKGCTDCDPGPGDSDSVKDTVSPIETGETASPPETGETAEPIVLPDVCAEDRLKVRDFDSSFSELDFDRVAPDFQLNLLDGSTWTYSEDNTGCDNLFFFNYAARMPYPDLTSEGLVRRWFEDMPRNSRIFFVSMKADAAEREEQLAEFEAFFRSSLERLSPEEQAFWFSRVHFVADRHNEMDGIGAINLAYDVPVFAIDRLQNLREVGYLCDARTGWETCPPGLLAYEGRFFNFESDRDERLQAEEATVVPVFVDQPVSDGGWAGIRSYADVTLPSAETMAGFDTLELDLEMRCAGHPDLSQCPAWDYIVNLYLCDLDDPLTTDSDESTNCNTEFGRWITTYWRPGRWVHDVTPLLALIKEGGTRRFAFYSTQYYEIDLDLRLSNRGKGYRPVELQPLFSGGGFHDHYNWGQWYLWDGLNLQVGTRPEDAYTYTGVADLGDSKLAQTGADHPYSPSSYARIYDQFDPMGSGTRYVCIIAGLADEAAARALTRSCLEDDPETADVDESLTCVGADPANLVSGCGTSPWIALEPGSWDMPPGSWAEIWNRSKLPQVVEVPDTATRVGLAAMITGHGFGDTDENCAEFCNHQHLFTLNSADTYTRDQLPWVEIADGCAEQVDYGTVPNQAGTWPFGRGGWCPGLQVNMWEEDITDSVMRGELNQVSYLGLVDGQTFRPNFGTWAHIQMSSYLVYYE